jgi:2',3'-cyclic-nucleotide 2'-phosphodiesterase (5'-nucleotidase family)
MKKILNGFLSALFCLALLPGLGTAQPVSLTILHTNDTHGHLLPFSYPSETAPGSELAGLQSRRDIGGIARRATLAKRVREAQQARGGIVWLVDAGDFTDGTSFSTEYHGEADIEAMNAAGYDFGTIGNHELNASLGTLKKLIGLAKFPLLCANLTDNATGRPLVPPSEIRKVGPLKIGIFGLTTSSAAGYPAAKDQLTIGNEIETARRMVERLKPETDIVILISHAGETTDEVIARQVPGIDVIIGGHSHTRLPLGQFIWRSDDLEERTVNGTVIVQAYKWGGELGRLDLLFGQDDKRVWHLERYRERLLEVTSDIPDDDAVAAVVARYWKPIAARYGEVIGQAGADFTEIDLANYNLVTDAIRETYGTEIALENTGGVRAPLIKGNITREDLTQLDPFANTVVTFKITGRQLKDVLLRSRPAVSGVRYRVEGQQLTEASVAGKPVVDTQVYTGVTNSYMAGTALAGISVVDTKRARLDVILEYVRKKGTVVPVHDGRRVIMN